MSVYSHQFRELYLHNLHTIVEHYGERCKTKDTDDFDDLVTVGDPDAGRCPTCLVYEKFDAYWNKLYHDDVEMS